MMNLKKVLALVLAFALVLSIAGCADEPDDTTQATAPSVGDNKKVSYTVSVETAGGMPMEGLDVYFYADNTLEDMEQFGRTDANGNVTVQLPARDGYVAVISGAPKGYVVDQCYPLVGSTTKVSLKSQLIAGNLADAQLKLGDVMYDFTLTDANGNEITLSKMLEEKDMVLLNFWYTTCQWCLKEFPYMQSVYSQFAEDVGIIALNPMEGNDVIKPFQEANGMTFNMASCPISWANAFGVNAYPTSIVVDRYGVICLIEVGGLPSEAPFKNMFNHFIGDNYAQMLCPNGVADISVRPKPTYTMPSGEDMAAVLNKGDLTVSYAPDDSSDSEYSWPFILGEKNGVACAYASNGRIDSSWAILTIDVELKKGQALGFDYLTSTESGADILYVIVDGDDIYQISGNHQEEKWESCYPCVADKDGTYKISLCYLKDDSDGAGDDTVYIKDVRTVDVSGIDTPTYLPRQAAVSEDGFVFTYADIIYNEKDGYYHVGSVDGPLLLACMNSTSQFNEDKSVLQMISNGEITVDGHNYYDEILPFCSYASNSSLYGYCTVNKELADYLKIVAQVAGFEDDENEWLKLCSYYATYGTNGVQLQDPIAGLAPFSAYEAKLGKDVETNFFYYDRVIMPRGTFARFVPEKSGVYRITSRNPAKTTVEGWIFNREMKELTVYSMDERLLGMQHPEGFEDISIVFYMEKGQEYFIDICFWDLYETGYIYYDIEYIAAEYDHFRLASPGFFTYDTNATGENMYYTIAGGVKPVLHGGKYYVDLGDGKRGSLLYADFSGVTPIFNMPLQQMIEAGGFDFTKTENDETVLQYLSMNDNDVDKTREYLKTLWGDDYAQNAEEYRLEDVFSGKFHGKGKDLTEQARAYISKMAAGPKERVGCVVVDEALAALLQQLMDKYTFAGVDHSWTKVCYYYDHLGPKQ